MNGHVADGLLWVLDKLIWLVAALIAFIIRIHLKSDEDHRQKIDEEIKRLRDKVNT